MHWQHVDAAGGVDDRGNARRRVDGVVIDVDGGICRVEEVGDDANIVLTHGDVVARPRHASVAEEILQLDADAEARGSGIDDRVVGDVGVGVGEQDDA